MGKAKRCAKCNSKFEDAAVTGKRATLIQARVISGRTKYLCNWCLCPNDPILFLEPRSISAESGRIFSGKLPRDREWYRLLEIDRYNNTDYLFECRGPVVLESDNPDLDNGWFFGRDDDPAKKFELVVIRIYYRFSLAFLEIYPQRPHPTIDLRNIGYVRSLQELEKVWNGRALFVALNCRRAGSETRKSFLRKSVGAAVGGKATLTAIAKEMGIPRSQWYRTARSFSPRVTAEEVRKLAEAREANADVKPSEQDDMTILSSADQHIIEMMRRNGSDEEDIREVLRNRRSGRRSASLEY